MSGWVVGLAIGSAVVLCLGVTLALMVAGLTVTDEELNRYLEDED